MNKVLVDIIDDIRSIEFTPKAWNYIGTILLVAAGIYWIVFSDYGDFFKVTGCIAYAAAAMSWINKTEWGQWCLDNLFEDEK